MSVQQLMVLLVKLEVKLVVLAAQLALVVVKRLELAQALVAPLL